MGLRQCRLRQNNFLPNIYLVKIVLLAMSLLLGRSAIAFSSDTARPVVALETGNQCTDAEVEYWVERWRRSHLPAGARLRACTDLAVPGLANVLNDDSLSLTTRGLTARILAQIGSIEAVNALLAAAQNSDLQPSIQQAFRVLNPAEQEAVHTLIKALYAESSTTATTAAIALGQIGSEPAILALLEALPSEAHQAAAFTGLGATNPNSRVALTILVTALDSESDLIQVGAAYGLAAMGARAESAIPALVNRLRQGRHQLEQELRWGPDAVIDNNENPDTFSIQAHQRSNARVMIVYALGEINLGNTRSLTALVDTLLISPWGSQELDDNVRDAAVEAFANLTPEDLPALLNTRVFNHPELVKLIEQIVDFDFDLELVNLLADPSQPLELRVSTASAVGHASALRYIGYSRAIPIVQNILVEMNYVDRLSRYYNSFLGPYSYQHEDKLVAYFFSVLGQLEFIKTRQLVDCIGSRQGYDSVCAIGQSQANSESDPLVWLAFHHPEIFTSIIALGRTGSPAANVAQVTVNVSNYQASSTPVICRSRLISRWLWRCRQ